MKFLVDDEARIAFDELAAASGMSKSFFFETLIAQISGRLRDNGTPNWWPDTDTNGLLPIDAA